MSPYSQKILHRDHRRLSSRKPQDWKTSSKLFFLISFFPPSITLPLSFGSVSCAQYFERAFLWGSHDAGDRLEIGGLCVCEKSGTKTPAETGCKHSSAWLSTKTQYSIILDMLKHKITHKWIVYFSNKTPIPFTSHFCKCPLHKQMCDLALGLLWAIFKVWFIVCITFSYIQMKKHLSLHVLWISISWLKLNSLSSICHLSVI